MESFDFEFLDIAKPEMGSFDFQYMPSLYIKPEGWNLVYHRPNAMQILAYEQLSLHLLNDYIINTKSCAGWALMAEQSLKNKEATQFLFFPVAFLDWRKICQNCCLRIFWQHWLPSFHNFSQDVSIQGWLMLAFCQQRVWHFCWLWERFPSHFLTDDNSARLETISKTLTTD